MARRKSKSKTRNIEPAVMTLTMGIPVPGGASVDATADLSQMASLVNRRFYRQGLNWAVSGFKVKAAQNGSIDISKLPNTWVMANSWTKGFKTWQEMNDKALEDSPSTRGRFLDFKIYMDGAHHSAGFANNLVPIDSAGNASALGEWLPSKIQTASGALSFGYELTGVGDNYPGVGASGFDAVSLIQGYSNSRSLPLITDPNVPLENADADGATPENWMTAISNEGTNQDSNVLEDVSEYDQPPYPYENDGANITPMYPGGATQLPELQPHDFQNFTGTTISKITYLKGGNFPCGLVRLKCTNLGVDTDVFIVQIDLVPGHHRGYMAESMLEM